MMSSCTSGVAVAVMQSLEHDLEHDGPYPALNNLVENHAPTETDNELHQ